MQLHGFSDASEEAYSGVVYLRMVDSLQCVYTSLVMSKTKVAPIKRLTIPRLELCGARLLAQLLHHVQEVFHLPVDNIYAWTDSMIVLSWLVGNPRRFKTYVGNRVSHIVELVPPHRWNHVNGTDNPADCASRGLFPSKLLDHELWWNGPIWLNSSLSDWPRQLTIPPAEPSDEVRQICHHAATDQDTPVIAFDRYSSFNRLKGITAWIFRFIENCRNPEYRERASLHLTTEELVKTGYPFCTGIISP